MPAARVIVQRAQPLLGTVVSVQLRVDDDAHGAAARAIDAAFAEIALVQHLMSAHDPQSDLGRLAAARPGARIALHAHTQAVLALAQDWSRRSAGAYDAQQAGEQLAASGRRPGIEGTPTRPANFLQLAIASEVILDGPLRLDLGGLAKGYAVDQAVRVLREHGMCSGLVNAGGDLRAFGDAVWAIDVQHAEVTARTRRLLRLREGAVASSVVAPGGDFVRTRRRAASWQRCTVLARDCASADALTKWALQAPARSLQLRSTLTRMGARLWRA